MSLIGCRSKAVVLSLLMLATAAAVPGGARPRQTDKDEIGRQVDRIFAQWDRPASPGCALVVVRDGAIVYKRGYGMANLEHSIPMSPTSVMDTASVSKQFTAMCIAMLAEQGGISLNDDIRKYLPEIPAYQNPITISHLIHHTSGLRDYLTLMSIAGMRDDDYYTDAEVLDLLARQKELNFKPGEQFLYSNSGYFLLGQIVKRVSGKTLRQFADEHIFRPLGMKNTRFYDNHTEIVKDRATGYAPLKAGGFRIDVTTLDMVGDGNVFTSAEDLYLWDQNFYHNKLGRGDQELIKLVETPGVLNSGEKTNYAFGLATGEYRGLKVIEHGGAFVGYRAMIKRFPEQRFTVICLCNLSSMNPSTLANRVADVYLAGQLAPDPAEAASAANASTKFIDLPEAELREKVGAYRNPSTGVMWKVTLEHGKLTAKVFGLTIQLAAVGRMEFKTANAPFDSLIRFERQAGGESFVMHVQTEGQKPATLEPVELVSPTAAELNDYVGDYFSEELQVSYRVLMQGGKLIVRHENPYKDIPRNPLEPTLKDSFSLQGIGLTFVRGERNRVSGFLLDAGRVRNIRFVRKADRAS
jgi:CubicO group peptidase (beta-lactamase class C family)